MRLQKRSMIFALVVAGLQLFAISCSKTPPAGDTGAVTPAIVTQPASQTVTVGQPVTFTVAASGTAPLTYQWQNGATNANISGATFATYTIASAATANSGSTFRVVVTNSAGSVTSSTATLTVSSAPVMPSIVTQPASQTVTVGQPATFTVVAAGTAPLSYQWQNAATNANISGATSASYTIAATALPDNGSTFRVAVTNSAGSITSATATLTVNSAPPPPPSSVSVLTYHNDVGRTGLNPNETILTTNNVNSTQFAKLGSLPVTGLVDAEPLYVPNLTINGAAHNVVFAVTEHDIVYAFDADTPAAPLWQLSVIPTGEVPSDDHGCGQVTPEIGITSTPVIDLSAGPNGTIFLVSMSKDAGNNYHQRLHALDLVTHAELNGGPTDIQASVSGTGTSSSSGVVKFNPSSYEERAALLLLNGVIYTTWTSHCDAANYTSWVIGYTESTLQQKSVLNLTANGTLQAGREGGIWMAGSGPAADSSGFIYLLVGNGTFDATLTGGFPSSGDYGNSFMKLSTSGGTLTVADYFAMNNGAGTANSESTVDKDLGSGGAMVLPDLTDSLGNIRHLAVGAGKDTNLYVVSRDSMGKFLTNDTGIYQELSGALSGGIWSAPAYFNNTVYYGPSGNNLLAFPISNAKLALSPSSTTSHSFGFPGATPSVSANGTSNGIVWVIETGSTGILHAYKATSLATELYNSNQSGSRDQFPDSSHDKFVTPMIANGKVYVGTQNAVVVFGLNGH
jgi:Immunoglobulin I-set domain